MLRLGVQDHRITRMLWGHAKAGSTPVPINSVNRWVGKME